MSNLHEFDEDKLLHDHNDIQAIDQFFCRQLYNYVNLVCTYANYIIALLLVEFSIKF